MKVAVLTSRWPWPLEKGDKLRLYHQLRALSEHVELHLVCLVDQEPTSEERAALAPWVSGLHAVKLSPWRRALRLAWAPLSSRPFQVHWFYQRGAHRQVLRVLGQIQPDQLLAQLIRTSEYVKELHEIPRTLDYMDALSAGMARRAEKHRGPRRWLFALEARRLKRYEASVFDYFDGHSIITEADQRSIAHPDRARIAIVPNGVDTAFFQPAPTPPSLPLTASFIGNMAYPPNVDAALRLALEIRPLAPSGVHWLIAGATPTPAVKALHGGSVEVTGWLDDIRLAYHRSHLFLAPIVLGSGQQNKLLEAMACGLPCIVSPQVRHGLGPHLIAPDGPLNPDRIATAHAILADSPQDFADRIAELADHPDWRAALGRNARRFVEEHASWSVESVKLLATFAAVPDETTPALRTPS